EEGLLPFLREAGDRFAGCVRLAAAPAYGGGDRFRLARAAALAEAAGPKLMAVHGVPYHAARSRPLQDVLTAIRLKTTVAGAGLALAANAERRLKPPDEMARLFRDHPAALDETLRFASELGFSLDALRYNYPDELAPDGA